MKEMLFLYVFLTYAIFAWVYVYDYVVKKANKTKKDKRVFFLMTLLAPLCFPLSVLIVFIEAVREVERRRGRGVKGC